jgi:hypothetical protein
MTTRARLIPVNSPAEIPEFATEAEEHQFWKTHSFGPGMYEHVEPDPLLDELLPARPRPITIRVDADVYRRLRSLAERRGRRYQALVQEFLIERLDEEEKREGIGSG